MINDKELENIINAYNTLVKDIHKKATENQNRSY